MTNRLTSFKPTIPKGRLGTVPSPDAEKPTGGANTPSSSTKLSSIVAPRKFLKAVNPASRNISRHADRSSSSNTRQDELATSSEEGSTTVENESSSFSGSEQSTEKNQSDADSEQNHFVNSGQSSASNGQIPLTPKWKPVITKHQKKLAALKAKSENNRLKRQNAQRMARGLKLTLEPEGNSESLSNMTELGHSLVPSTNSSQHDLRPKKTIFDLIPGHRIKTPLEVLRKSKLYKDAVNGDGSLTGLFPLVLDGYLSSLLNDPTAAEIIGTSEVPFDAAVGFRWYGQAGFPIVQQSLREKLDPGSGYKLAPPGTFENFVKACRRGFAKLPASLLPGMELFRGTDFLFDENLKPGDVFTDPAFVSTSKSTQVAQENFPGRFLLKFVNIPIDDPRWRNISDFTDNRRESEILCLPGVTFRVVSRVQSDKQVPFEVPGGKVKMVNQEIITLEPIGIN